MSADATGLVLGVSLGLLFAAGDEDFVGEGEAFGFGVGETVFAVVTDTLGSDELVLAEAVNSGDAAGEGLSSWAKARGVPAAKRSAVRARTMVFIWLPLVDLSAAPSLGRPVDLRRAS